MFPYEETLPFKIRHSSYTVATSAGSYFHRNVESRLTYFSSYYHGAEACPILILHPLFIVMVSRTSSWTEAASSPPTLTSALSLGSSTRPRADDVPPNSINEPVAIIGFSLKLPGEATTIESFWETMINARCTASEFPKDRINLAAYYDPDQSTIGTVCMSFA
jgi:hypothetical protein